MAVDRETGTIHVAAFTRTKSAPRGSNFVASSIDLPNSMTVINPIVMKLATGEGAFGIPVGQGPCSISIFEIG